MPPIPLKTSISSSQDTGILWVSCRLSTIPLQDKPCITHCSTAVCALLGELNRAYEHRVLNKFQKIKCSMMLGQLTEVS